MTVTPAIGLIDEPLQLTVRGLSPGVTVTTRARLVDVRGAAWSSYAAFVAGADGSVDLTTQSPISGTYSAVDGEGLIASLAIDADIPSRTFDGSSLEPLQIDFDAELEGQIVARATARRLYGADDVRTTVVREDGLSGLFFRPPDDEPRPAVIVLGGSSGGLVFASQVASLLASHGFASLALAYFGLEGLPEHLVEIPLEYFGGAIDWLSSQPGVKRTAIAVVGRSRGAELALLLGTRFSSLRAVVAYCPTGIVWNGIRRNVPLETSAWSESGRPLPFCSLVAPDIGDVRARVFRTSPIALTPLFEAALDRPVPAEAVIPVEQINGPILLISGADDSMCPSVRMGEQIMDRLAARSHPFQSKHCRYSGAGHLMRPPGVSTRVVHDMFAFGGDGAAQAKANRAAWSETLAFLAGTLDLASSVDAPAAIGGERGR